MGFSKKGVLEYFKEFPIIVTENSFIISFSFLVCQSVLLSSSPKSTRGATAHCYRLNVCVCACVAQSSVTEHAFVCVPYLELRFWRASFMFLRLFGNAFVVWADIKTALFYENNCCLSHLEYIYTPRDMNEVS